MQMTPSKMRVMDTMPAPSSAPLLSYPLLPKVLCSLVDTSLFQLGIPGAGQPALSR